MTTATLTTAPAAAASPRLGSYASIEDLFARAELAELAGQLGRALDSALFAARLRSDLEDALDIALVEYDLEQLSKAEAVARLLAA